MILILNKLILNDLFALVSDEDCDDDPSFVEKEEHIGCARIMDGLFIGDMHSAYVSSLNYNYFP